MAQTGNYYTWVAPDGTVYHTLSGTGLPYPSPKPPEIATGVPLPTTKPSLNDQGLLTNPYSGTYDPGQYPSGVPNPLTAYGPQVIPTYGASAQALNGALPSAVFNKEPHLSGTGSIKAFSLATKYQQATNIYNKIKPTLSSTNSIKQIQTNLGYLGYYKGKVTGEVDDATKTALSKWSKANNLNLNPDLVLRPNSDGETVSNIAPLSKLDDQVYEKEAKRGFKSLTGESAQGAYSDKAKRRILDKVSEAQNTQFNSLVNYFGGSTKQALAGIETLQLLSNGMKDAKSFESMIKSFSELRDTAFLLKGLGVEETNAQVDLAGTALRELMQEDSKFARAVENYLADNDELQNEFINVAGCSGARPPAKQDGTLAMPAGVDATSQNALNLVNSKYNPSANPSVGYGAGQVDPGLASSAAIQGYSSGFTGGAEPPSTGVTSSSAIDGIQKGTGQNPGNSFAEPNNAGNMSTIDNEKTNDVTEKAQEEAKKENKRRNIANQCAPGVINITQIHAVTGKLSPVGVYCNDGKLSAVQYCQRAKDKKNATRTGKSSTGRSTTGGSRKGISNMNPLNALKSAMGRGFPGKGNGGGMTEEDIRASFKEDPLETLRKMYEDFANSLGTKSVLEVLLPELYSLNAGGAFDVGTLKQMTESYDEYVGALLTDENTIDLRKLFVLLYFGSLVYDQFMELDANLTRLYFEFLLICEEEGLTANVAEDIDVADISEITRNAMKTLTGYYFNFINADLTAYENQIIIPPSANRVEVINSLTNVIKKHLEIYGRFYTIKLFSVLMFGVATEDSTIINDDTLKRMYFDFRKSLERNGFDETVVYTAEEYVEFVVPAFESIF